MEICKTCEGVGGYHYSWCDKTHKHFYRLARWGPTKGDVYLFFCYHCNLPCVIPKYKFREPQLVLVDERDPSCVEGWPECVDGEYDPRCCRFPKSCSAGFHGARVAT